MLCSTLVFIRAFPVACLQNIYHGYNRVGGHRAAHNSFSHWAQRQGIATAPTSRCGGRSSRRCASKQNMAPVDGGSAAWKLLCAAFMFEALLWDEANRGAANEYYRFSTLLWRLSVILLQNSARLDSAIWASDSHSRSSALLAVVATYDLCRMCVSEIPSNRYANRRLLICLPGSICIASLVLGSFASTLEVLILTQGVAYGVGFLIFYYPILSMVNEYWVARRCMAYGILCGASGVSGSVIPFVLQALLARYGYRTTLRAVAMVLTLLTRPFIPLLKGRLSSSERANTSKISLAPLFWVYSLSNLLQGFGYFFPSLYLPSVASSLGLGGKSGALLLALMSVSQVGGQFVFGLLSDRKVLLDVLACLSTVVAAVACLTAWRLARVLPVLVIFAITYGFFGAGFTAAWARMSTAITADSTAVPMVFSLLDFGKGIGNVLSGPIGGFLVSISKSTGTSSSLSYRWIVVFTGVAMFASALTISSQYLKHIGIPVTR
ncbi:hypothetical protein RRF57_008963 [Xylaria bambusicola]|uniref:Major facilitator superfamily (MFS) profile domain-containing protein n=1 Tax=Xylaria bambusicola TaxID=326684 RepID=A0AAN7ZBP8_9PEZI